MQLLKNFRVHSQNSTLQEVSFAPKAAFPAHRVYAGGCRDCSNPHRGRNEERLALTETLMLFFALRIRPCRMDGKQPTL